MDKLSFYKYATWGLLLLNISILVFFIFIVGPPDKGGMRGRRARATDLLKLDRSQNESFTASVMRHEKRLDEFNKQQKKMLELYFLSVLNVDSDINMDSLEQKIAVLEVQKIKSAYQHFEEVKSDLSNDQVEHFETFIRNILDKIGGPSKKNRH